MTEKRRHIPSLVKFYKTADTYTTLKFLCSSLTAAQKYISERHLRPLLFLEDEALEVSEPV